MGLTKLPTEVLVMVGAACAYEDLNNLVRVSQYFHACLQPVLDSHRRMVSKYKHGVDVYTHSPRQHCRNGAHLPSFAAAFDVELQCYTHPLFLLAEIQADPSILDYLKHLTLGRVDNYRPQGHVSMEYVAKLTRASERVRASENFWRQSRRFFSVECNEVRGILERNEEARAHVLHPHGTVPREECNDFVSMCLLVLPKLRHLELRGDSGRQFYWYIQAMWSTLVSCLNARDGKTNLDMMIEDLPFHSLTHVTIRSAPTNRTTLQDLVSIAVLPFVRQLDCYDVVDPANGCLTWSLPRFRSPKPSWEQVYFHDCILSPVKLKTFCTPLKSLTRLQYSAKGNDVDMEGFLEKFTRVSKRTLGMRGFSSRLVNASSTLVVERAL